MSDMIRPETAHSINGVTGRLHNLRRPPAPWKAGTFGNQTWVSEARPVKGYGTNGRMTVNIRFDDNYRNGHNSFAITADIRSARGEEAGGRMHDEIATVFPELAHLIKWHLCSTDGPMHYVANTTYHASDRDSNGLLKGEKRQIRNGKMRDLDHARSSAVWPDATDEELCAEPEVLKAALMARLPALQSAMRADIESAGFMWECPAAE